MHPTVNDVTLAAALAAALAIPSAASAQCGNDGGADGGPDPLEVGTLRDSFPADQGAEVPTDTPVRLRYNVRVPDPAIIRVHPGTPDAEPLRGGSAVAVGNEIVWTAPGGRLDPNTRYYVVYQEQGGGTSRITFTTGRGASPERLFFAGLNEVKADDAPDDRCDPDAVDITVRFDRAGAGALNPSTIPWPDIDVEYVIYETRGPGIAGARERDRVRLQRSGSTLVTGAQRTFRLRGADADGPVCFNVQAVDPLGRSDGNTFEQCVNPVRGNYFQGCSTTPGGASPWRGAAPLAALALAALVSARRRR